MMIGWEKNRKKPRKIRIALAVFFLSFLIVNESMADGGEEEEDWGEQYLIEEQVKDDKLSEGLKKMDYALFLETDVGFGVTSNYYRYGIYGDFTDTTEEGEKVYFDLCEKLLGIKLAMSSHEEWADNKMAHIQNLSPDLQWVVAREYPNTPSCITFFKDKVFHNGQFIEEAEAGKIYEDNILFDFQAEEGGSYILLDKESLEKKKKIARKLLGHSYLLASSVTSIDGNGKLLAVAGPSNQEIRIYRLEDEELLYGITVDNLNRDWPIAISQIVGTENGGWVVFSNGDAAYRMDYPDGNAEKIGEYMYGTMYSPDEKYRAYCTGNMELEELGLSIIADDDKYDKLYDKYCELYHKWKEIPPGWYIEELESGKKIYIPIDTWKQDDKPLFGGRCIWLEKSRLLEILDLEREK